MHDHDVPDHHLLPVSVAPGLLHLDHGQLDDGSPMRRLDMHVGRVVFARPEEEPVRTGPEQGGHADLADGSTGGHHDRMHFTTAYLSNPAVSDG